MAGLGTPELVLLLLVLALGLLGLAGIVAPIAAGVTQRLTPVEVLLAVIVAILIPLLGGVASIVFTVYRCNHRDVPVLS